MKNIILAALVLLMVVPSCAQKKGSIIGRVTNANSGVPIAGVTVTIYGTGNTDKTDRSGNYHLYYVPADKQIVQFSCNGYMNLNKTNVLIQPDSTIRLDAQLDTGSVNITHTEVTPEEKDKTVISLMRVSKLAACAPMCIADQEQVSYYTANFNTEAYDKITENDFLDAAQNPLSTFSIDVDVASYGNARRFIRSGSLPPIDAVRTEEFVNYFSYSYPEPTDGHPFSVTTELASAPWSPNHHLMMIGLQGKHISTDKLPPGNLVFLLDVSGSMEDPNKLPLVKSAFHLLVNQLRSIDKVAIVVYAGNAGLVLPSTSGNEKTKILNAIDNLEAGGSTAGGQGIILAYKIAKNNFLKDGNNRVILATDGDFNVGASSDAEMERLIEEKRKDGIYLSVLGFGMGNYKDSKMEKLADKGNGNYAYIDNILEAKKVFVGQLAGTLYTIAKDVKLQVEFNPAKVKAYRLIGYENRLLNKEDFNNDLKDAGDMGAGHSVTAFYEIVPVGVDIELPKVDSLKYQRPAAKGVQNQTDELLTVKIRYKPPKDTVSILQEVPVLANVISLNKTTSDFQFATSVVQFCMILRESKNLGNTNYDNILESARVTKGEDKEGYRSEFIQLVEMCKSLPKRITSR
jgi:Ca-activated chloride channel homolog